RAAVRIAVDLDAARADRQTALAANAMFALASHAAVRWSAAPETDILRSDAPLLWLGRTDLNDPLASLLTAAPEPGTDELELWIRNVPARLASVPRTSNRLVPPL